MPNLALVRRSGKTKIGGASEYDDACRLWTLRIISLVLTMKATRYHQFFEEIRSFTEILETIGMTEYKDEKLSVREFRKLIEHEIELLELDSELALGGVLKSNLALLQQHLGFHDEQLMLIAFLALINRDKGLGQAVAYLGGFGPEKLSLVVGITLDISESKVKKSLFSSNGLVQSGLVRVGSNFRMGSIYLEENITPLELIEGFSDSLLISHDSILEMFSNQLSRGKSTSLETDDFDYLNEHTQLLSLQMRQMWKSRSKRRGTNFLIYGPPGTGKSEYAKMLAQLNDSNVYEVNVEDNEGKSLSGSSRFGAYQLMQRLIANHQRSLVIFDEIEDVFDQGSFTEMGSGGKRQKDIGKSWVNQLLETNPVPTIWISNSISSLDPAYLRRFDQVIELNTPPQRVRKRILTNSLASLKVSSQWIEKMSEIPTLAPALVTRAAKVVRMSSPRAKKEVVEMRLEKLIGNTMKAMGQSGYFAHRQVASLDYNLEYLNTNLDIHLLVEGLSGNKPVGRFCLYGPPGTGKTEFGRYLAKKLDKPLLIKRSSDLLSMYVGEVEKNIATMFDEARSDDAILLLDEADSFLRERRTAHQSWEVTQVNELLTQMESFDGLFISSTNLIESLDAASLRRFDFKIHFNYLRPNQSWRLFNQLLDKSKVSVSTQYREVIASFNNLTPGDFAVVARQQRLMSKTLTPESLLERLTEESTIKPDRGGRPIGFTAVIH